MHWIDACGLAFVGLLMVGFLLMTAGRWAAVAAALLVLAAFGVARGGDRPMTVGEALQVRAGLQGLLR